MWGRLTFISSHQPDFQSVSQQLHDPGVFTPVSAQQVILAQCAIYMARAPKSVDVYQAYTNVKACLRNHKGPLPSVPLHLRNAPTRLMKQLGYAKGYKYNPAFSGTVEQEYLPDELQGTDFFTWTPNSNWQLVVDTCFPSLIICKGKWRVNVTFVYSQLIMLCSNSSTI